MIQLINTTTLCRDLAQIARWMHQDGDPARAMRAVSKSLSLANTLPGYAGRQARRGVFQVLNAMRQSNADR